MAHLRTENCKCLRLIFQWGFKFFWKYNCYIVYLVSGGKPSLPHTCRTRNSYLRNILVGSQNTLFMLPNQHMMKNAQVVPSDLKKLDMRVHEGITFTITTLVLANLFLHFTCTKCSCTIAVTDMRTKTFGHFSWSHVFWLYLQRTDMQRKAFSQFKIYNIFKVYGVVYR